MSNVIPITPFQSLYPLSKIKKGEFALDWVDSRNGGMKTWFYSSIPSFAGWEKTFEFVLYNDKKEVIAQCNGFRLIVARQAFENEIEKDHS